MNIDALAKKKFQLDSGDICMPEEQDAADKT